MSGCSISRQALAGRQGYLSLEEVLCVGCRVGRGGLVCKVGWGEPVRLCVWCRVGRGGLVCRVGWGELVC